MRGSPTINRSTWYAASSCPIAAKSSRFEARTIVFSGGYYDIANFGGTVSSLGYNLIGVDPLLGPLQDNGGPTFTHAPLPGSPVIDAGNNFSGADFDQRGLEFLRTVDFSDRPNAAGGDGTDIGAVEVQ